MRLIDADALKKEIRENDPFGGMNYEWYIDHAPTIPAAPRWRRVEEELPEPHKDVLVSGMEAINNSRVYKVMVNDNGTWRPTDYAPSIRWDYWMPIEPPKEDA